MNHATPAPDPHGVLAAPGTLTIRRLLPGPIERVWAYLTDGELRRKWLAAGQMELMAGAPFELVWRKKPSRVLDQFRVSESCWSDPTMRLRSSEAMPTSLSVQFSFRPPLAFAPNRPRPCRF